MCVLVQGLWEINYYRNWIYGLVFMVGNVNLCELRTVWATFLTLRQKIVQLPKQCWIVEEGQVLDSLT
jgi:hypothetical protein